MSRTIAGTPQWDSAVWGAGGTDTPYGATWAAATQSTDLATVVSTVNDPATWDHATWGASVWTDGVGTSVGPQAAGGLNFVVQILDPTLAIDTQWNVGTWDTSLWSASVGNWHDLSPRVRGVHWEQGSDQPGDLDKAATADITIANLDGAASPWATTGEFHGPGARPWLRAGVLVRFGVISTDAAHAAVPLDYFNAFFTGRVDAIEEDSEANADGWVTLRCVECIGDIGTTPQADQLVQGVDGHTLTEVLWQAIELSSWQFQTSLTVPDDDVLSALAILRAADMTSLERLRNLVGNRHWNLITDGRGRLRIVERHADNLESGVTFTNDVHTAGEYPFETVGPYAGTDRVVNTLTGQRDPGDTGVATDLLVEDTASQDQFGIITDRYGFPRRDLIVRSDTDVLWLLNHVLGLCAWDDLGLASINLDTGMDLVNLPAVLTFVATQARYGYVFAVRWVHPSGNTYRERVVVEGMVHDITPQGPTLLWTCSLRLGHAGNVSGA